MENAMAARSPTIGARESSCKGECGEQDAWRDFAPSSAMLRCRAEAEAANLLSLIDEAAGKQQYEPLERQLIVGVFRLGRLLIALFLCLTHERTPVSRTERGKERYRRQPAKSRMLGTFFGKVRYWRAYLEQTNGRPGGYYPVDLALGLVADGFSMDVLSRAV